MNARPTITVVRAALALLLTGAVLAFGFSANNYLLQAGTTLAMSAVLCLAWNIVGGFMGYPSFATAAFFGLGAYIGGIAGGYLGARMQSRLPDTLIRRTLGILEKSEEVCLRATFIVDPENIIRFVSVNDMSVGRNPAEVLRVLDALQTDELCPCNWQKGEETLKAA